MKKKKDVPEVSGPMNWEELPEGEQVDWNAFGRVDLMFPDNGGKVEEQPEEEAAKMSAAGVVEEVRPEVLRYTAATVMSTFTGFGARPWTEERALNRMPRLMAETTAAVKAVCPGKQFTEEDVRTAVLEAVKVKNLEADFADTVRNKWTGNGITLADSMAYVLNHFRKQLPDIYQDNPVIGWSIRNDGCTFIFRDGQKKVIGL